MIEEQVEEKLEVISYLIFEIGGELYAANVEKIESIIEIPKITKVPNSPPHLIGVINLRGVVLPVIDARIRMGTEVKECTEFSGILILEVDYKGEQVLVGALVDAVNEVVEILPGRIDPPPTMGLDFQSTYLKGVFKRKNGSFLMILNLDQVFAVDDAVTFEKTMV